MNAVDGQMGSVSTSRSYLDVHVILSYDAGRDIFEDRFFFLINHNGNRFGKIARSINIYLLEAIIVPLIGLNIDFFEVVGSSAARVSGSIYPPNLVE